MSDKAIELLVDIYGVPKGNIAFIEHRVPDFLFSQEISKKEFKFENRKVLFTFGFVGRNKGIETLIRAFHRIVS